MAICGQSGGPVLLERAMATSHVRTCRNPIYGGCYVQPDWKGSQKKGEEKMSLAGEGKTNTRLNFNLLFERS